MKQLFGIFISLSLVVSCAKPTKMNDEVTESIGGNRDEYGCLMGAGQTWSQLKKTCIQVFTTGIRFNPVEVKVGEATYSAFVITDSKNSKVVELFIPDLPESILLRSEDTHVYQNGKYRYDKDKGTISYNQTIKYIKD